MNAGALLTNVQSSAASGAASEPGASLLDVGKAGQPGQVDAFTQALAALLGLPAQPQTAQATTNAAPAVNVTQLPVAVPTFALPRLPKAAGAFTLPPPANAGAGGQGGLASIFVLPAGDGLAKTAAAQSLGAAPNAAPQPAGQPAAAGPTTARGASATSAVSVALASLSLTGRTQSEIVATPTDDAGGDGTAAAISSALAPLAVGAGRLGLTLQPAQATVQKAAPTAPQTKTGAKTDSASTGTQTTASAADEEPPIEPLHAAANTADDQGQQAGGHAGGQTAAQSQSAQPAASNASANATATTLALAPGAAAAQALTSLSPVAPPIASQLATQVVKAVEGKSTHFDIALEPAGFGRVDVKLQIDAQGQVSAQFSFDSAHAAAEAKAQVGQLQQALEQAGFTVGQGGLSFDVGGQGAGLARQDAQSPPPTAVSALQSSALADATALAPQSLPRRPVSGLDITI
ncbi:MAG TPA: flagellar hook-length control protein FliK [Caulobacteraceae bacterium]|nr:flagellar hook-length control protein FliK [Caulobacteraceae bacterium]